MSEYVTVESAEMEDPLLIELRVNQRLTTAGRERYRSVAEGDLGSPLAQTLFSAVPGIATLEILPDSLLIRRRPEFPPEELVGELRAVLRDFFL